MRRRVLAIGFAAFLGTLPVGSQTSIELDEARILVFKLVAEGQFDTASALARTLLEADPNDQAALLALAQAERGAGRTKSAIQAARGAWKNSDQQSEKFASATVMAQALATDGQRLRAQFWLRRAAQVAPNDAFKARAARDFQFVRTTTPTRVNLRFSVSPSNNINNGSRNETATFGGLPFQLSGDARALSGIEYKLGADLAYIVLLSERQNLTFGVGFDSSRYTLSSSAKAQAPNVSASDFAFDELRFSLTTKRRDADKPAFVEASMTFGQNWYGGTPLTRFVRLDLDRTLPLNAKSTLGFGLGAERQLRLDNDARSATILEARTSYSRALGNGSVLGLSGRISDTDSASAIIAHQSARIDVSYRLGKPLFGETNLELGLGVEKRRYDRPALFGFGARRDERISASATLVLNDLDYFGFSPTATVNLSQTNSNIPLNETENIGLNFGLRSAF